eukprot:11280672-Alexandrium_andersonii.AAC.1
MRPPRHGHPDAGGWGGHNSTRALGGHLPPALGEIGACVCSAVHCVRAVALMPCAALYSTGICES